MPKLPYNNLIIFTDEKKRTTTMTCGQRVVLLYIFLPDKLCALERQVVRSCGGTAKGKSRRSVGLCRRHGAGTERRNVCGNGSLRHGGCGIAGYLPCTDTIEPTSLVLAASMSKDTVSTSPSCILHCAIRSLPNISNPILRGYCSMVSSTYEAISTHCRCGPKHRCARAALL